MNMTVLYNTTTELERYIPSFGGSSCPCDTTEYVRYTPSCGGSSCLHLEGRISQLRRNWSYIEEKIGTNVLPPSLG